MNWKIDVLAFLTLFLSCKNKEEAEKVITAGADSVAVVAWNKPLIEVEELMSISDGKHIKLVDFRKYKEYDAGHLPMAMHMWRDDIEDKSYPYKGMMASSETIETLFSKLGIRNEDTLVVYDKHGSYDAARLWWVLKNHNFDAVKILNGGIKTWIAKDGAVTEEIPKVQPTQFKLRSTENMPYAIGLDSLLVMIDSKNPPLLLDARTHDEHSGKRRKLGAKRAGHIPKSKWLDWAESVDYHGSGEFLSTNDLEVLYGRLNVDKNHPIVTYCHTGVRSAHTTFVLTQLLGYKNVKNYDGSWSEWSYHVNLPIEKDSITTILQ